MKNWHPLLSGPLLAMERRNGWQAERQPVRQHCRVSRERGRGKGPRWCSGDTYFIVLEYKVLIVELGVVVDARAASAVAVDKVAALDHEVLDHTVEL